MSTSPNKFLVILASSPHCLSSNPDEVREFVDKHVAKDPKLTPANFVVVYGSDDIKIVPPQKTHQIVIGKAEKKTSDEYKACAKGDACTGKVDNKPGNAYRKPKGMCAADYATLPAEQKVQRKRAK